MSFCRIVRTSNYGCDVSPCRCLWTERPFLLSLTSSVSLRLSCPCGFSTRSEASNLCCSHHWACWSSWFMTLSVPSPQTFSLEVLGPPAAHCCCQNLKIAVVMMGKVEKQVDCFPLPSVRTAQGDWCVLPGTITLSGIPLAPVSVSFLWVLDIGAQVSSIHDGLWHLPPHLTS